MHTKQPKTEKLIQRFENDLKRAGLVCEDGQDGGDDKVEMVAAPPQLTPEQEKRLTNYSLEQLEKIVFVYDDDDTSQHAILPESQQKEHFYAKYLLVRQYVLNKRLDDAMVTLYEMSVAHAKAYQWIQVLSENLQIWDHLPKSISQQLQENTNLKTVMDEVVISQFTKELAQYNSEKKDQETDSDAIKRLEEEFPRLGLLARSLQRFSQISASFNKNDMASKYELLFKEATDKQIKCWRKQMFLRSPLMGGGCEDLVRENPVIDQPKKGIKERVKQKLLPRSLDELNTPNTEVVRDKLRNKVIVKGRATIAFGCLFFFTGVAPVVSYFRIKAYSKMVDELDELKFYGKKQERCAPLLQQLNLHALPEKESFRERLKKFF